jgi:RNA polymerase sigma-70 factor (ECF subfamily)
MSGTSVVKGVGNDKTPTDGVNRKTRKGALRMTTQPNEPDLLRLAAFEASRSRIHSIASRILGNPADAEDVVQDTFIKWHMSSVDALRVPAAWLTTVATRLAIDRLRHARYERAPLSDALLENMECDTAPSAETIVERASDLSHGIRLLLERLSAEERTALLLHEAFDADYASIANVLGRTPAHCRQIVHRAKQRVLTDKLADKASRARTCSDASWDAAAIAPLVDAIASQDLAAVVALGRGETVSSITRTTASAMAWMETRTLMARLRMGSVRCASAARADEREAVALSR